ncbi:hypothetical protein J421_6303 (plasmid) [Gemmatirosa kalamazoonensis]|uniref:Uncharacterized protein n=1 Tax=Gemmatirosa kalamazoonensis TaxID=861299 RepID=W0RW85_9BACT|nr:hypothetical protein [Gemmatirosa kalamazoonensis]AHG93838.1 hypothetical protein J421_6303 [Gemmatirosa kalamazoonensis]
MLTSLTINRVTYDAVHLLSLLQQAYPQQSPPASGNGADAKGWQTPWKPDAAREWFWCAKRIARYTRKEKFDIGTATDAPGAQFWFDVGGQLISIAANTLYARYHGAVPTVPPKGAPGKLKAEISYAGIYMKLLEDHQNHVSDTATAAAIRAILSGGTAAGNDQALTLLVSVMFLSEVARNHTAFHTGLMLLDLIEKGIKVDTSTFQYTLQNSLCNPGTIDALVARRTVPTTPVPKLTGEADVKPASGGEQAIVAAGMGLAPMSHALSESGGALDLAGRGRFVPAQTQPTDPMSQTRRKEATLLIRWLFEALKKKGGVEVAVGDGAIAFDRSQPYNFDDRYFADTPGAGMMDMVHAMPLLAQRASTLDCML